MIVKLLSSIDAISDIFMNHKVLIPKVLDPKIECQFTADQKALRQKAFLYLSDPGIYVGQFVLIDKPKPVTILLAG